MAKPKDLTIWLVGRGGWSITSTTLNSLGMYSSIVSETKIILVLVYREIVTII